MPPEPPPNNTANAPHPEVENLLPSTREQHQDDAALRTERVTDARDSHWTNDQDTTRGDSHLATFLIHLRLYLV